MIRNLDRRLQKLESMKPSRIILEVVSDSETRRMTVPEFAKRGHVFSEWRILSGGDLEDLDLLLGTITAWAWEEVKL